MACAGGVVFSFLLFGQPGHTAVLAIIAIALICGGIALVVVGALATNQYNQAATTSGPVDRISFRESREMHARATSVALAVAWALLACLAVEAWLLYAGAEMAAAIVGVGAIVGIGVAIRELRRRRN
jgi:hypothetical protein